MARQRKRITQDEARLRLEHLINGTEYEISKFRFKGYNDCEIEVRCKICGMPRVLHPTMLQEKYSATKLRHCLGCRTKSYIALAKMYDDIFTFMEEAPKEYGFLNKLGLIEKECSHMKGIERINRPKKIRDRVIYSYKVEHNGEKFIYVGVTVDLRRRDGQHRNGYGAIKGFCDSIGVDIPPYIQETDYMSAEEASVMEGKVLAKYIDEGYIPVNSKKTGCLGPESVEEYSIEELCDIASRYKSVTEWRMADNKSYYYAYLNGIIDEVMPHRRRRHRINDMTREYVLSVIESYPESMTMAEFRAKENNVYNMVMRNHAKLGIDRDIIKRRFKASPYKRHNFTVQGIKECMCRYATLKDFRMNEPYMTKWCLNKKFRLENIWNERFIAGIEEPHIKNIELPQVVLCYDLGGMFIRKFSSTEELYGYKFNPKSVIDCCEGLTDTHQGYIFVYDEN